MDRTWFMNAAAHSGSFVQLLCRADDMIESWHHRQSDPLEADARCLIGVIIERRSRMIYSGTTLRLTAPTRLTSPMSARRNIERRSCQCVPNRDSVQLLSAKRRQAMSFIRSNR
jgi:hypothetical protein